MKFHASIRTKIVVSTQLVMVVVVVLGTLVTFLSRAASLEGAFQNRATQLVRMVSSGMANDVWIYDFDGIRQTTNALFVDPEVLGVEVTEPGGKVLYTNNRAGHHEASGLTVDVPILRGDVALASLSVAFSRQSIAQSLAAETGTFLLLMLVLTLGTLVGNSLAASHILKPLQSLVSAIEDFGDGKAQATSADSVGLDEISLVYLRFLQMSEVVEAKNTALLQLAYFDPMTGLPNRAKVGEEITARIERGRADPSYLCQISIVDIDNFQVINDTFGVATGDQMLKEMATRLREISRDRGWWVGRLGDDEFLVIDETPGLAATPSLVDALCGPYTVMGVSQKLTVSVGHSQFPGDGEHLAELLRASDTALLAAKGAGKACEKSFNPEMGAALQSRLVLEAELELALTRGELHLEFQPQYSNHAKRVTSFEALLRWNNARLGAVPPSVFIPVAERTGAIIPLGYWVLESAIAFLQQLSVPDVDVSVNLSAVQFMEQGLVEKVASLVRATGADPRRIVLEITESVFIQSFSKVSGIIQGLRDLGFRLSLDDFGTGYSSLAYLGNIRFDELKIDRSFLERTAEDRSSREIFRSIVSLAQRLGMSVVVEGVEQPAQLDFCRTHGCHKIQGYLLSRPLSAEKAKAFLHQEGQAGWT